MTYTGHASFSKIETGFPVDFNWIKSRVNSSPYDHVLSDSVRGAGKFLKSSETASEIDNPNTVTSFDSDGVTIGQDWIVNADALGYVSWNFRGGDTVTNNDGSIQSEVSANKDMGFSVVKWNMSMQALKTIGHGLGKIPDLIITKKINGTQNWEVHSTPTGNDDGLVLNDSGPAVFQPTWGSFQPTDKLFMFTQTAGDYIAYCFANTEMIHVGQYTGNSSVDGPFISLPFKPAYSMIKMIQPHDGYNWLIFDNKRNPYNVVGKQLMANESSQESDSPKLDFLSNGFKLRDSSYNVNVTGCTYLYLAISEQNFKNSRGR